MITSPISPSNITTGRPSGANHLALREDVAWYLGLPIVLAGMLVGAGARALFGSSAYLFDTGLAVGVLLLVCLVPLILRLRQGQCDVFEMGVGYGLVYFLYFGARTLWILHDPQTLYGESPYPSVVLAGLPGSVWFAGLGMSAYLVGYALACRANPSRFLASWRIGTVDSRVVLGFAVALYALGFLARLPGLAHGWFMGFAAAHYAHSVPALVHSVTYLLVFGLMGYALLFVCFSLPAVRKSNLVVLVSVIVPLEVLYAFLTGSKFHLVMLLSIPVIIHHYLLRRVSVGTLVGLLAVFVLMIAPVVTIYRGAVDYRQLTLRTMGREVPRVLGTVGESLARMAPATYVNISLGAFLHRLSGADGLAVSLRGVPSTEAFRRGRTLAWMAKILVPTAAWPTKYDRLQSDLRVAPRLFGYPDFVQGGLALTEPGELWLNFGILGILGGMSAVGAAQGTLVAWLLRAASPLNIFLYSLVWAWMLMSVEGWFYAVYPNVLRTLALALLCTGGIIWLSQRRPAVGPREVTGAL